MKKLFDTRRDYTSESITIGDLQPDPMMQFEIWYKEIQKAEEYEYNAFVLGTSTKSGRPSTRFLLLKAFDKEGFIFFTNYESRKSQEIAENPLGSMAFYWPITQRQVRIEGSIDFLSNSLSDEYFSERPEGSKIGAWASPQSKPIPNREYIEKLKKEYFSKYAQFRVPRPEFWGGYKLIPERIEFWQGKKDRLHDRFEYQRTDDNWSIERLAP